MNKCETCHAKFTPKKTNQRYCTKSCCDRAIKLQRRYKITPTEVYFMYKKQNGRCAICNTRGDVKELGFTKYPKLCIDHNHKSGEVRGLLCTHCNLAIGHAKESVDLLRAAIKYLRKYKRNKHVRRKQNSIRYRRK